MNMVKIKIYKKQKKKKKSFVLYMVLSTKFWIRLTEKLFMRIFSTSSKGSSVRCAITLKGIVRASGVWLQVITNAQLVCFRNKIKVLSAMNQIHSTSDKPSCRNLYIYLNIIFIKQRTLAFSSNLSLFWTSAGWACIAFLYTRRSFL